MRIPETKVNFSKLTSRATLMETGLFEIHADDLQNYQQSRQLLPDSREVAGPGPDVKADRIAVKFARCCLRLANLPNFAFDRSAAMKRHCGVRLRGSCLRLMRWTGASPKNEDGDLEGPLPGLVQI
jgi:hypothetical protein